jgi:acetoacetyl-CoA synthetase
VSGGDVLWEPTPESMAAAPLGAFTRWLRGHASVELATYDQVWRWSTDDLEAFWAALWAYHGVGTRDPDEVLPARVMPGADWFRGARVNYGQELLRRAPSDAPALVAVGEDHRPRAIGRAEIERRAGALAATLRAHGVGRGDRVAGFVPNVPEAVVALVATASLGAIWTSCAPDFGGQSVIDRFAQVRPKALVAAPSYRFNGRVHDRRAVLAGVRRALPGLAVTITLGDDEAALPDALGWAEAIAGDAPLTFVDTAFGDPLWILFSSGTTGTPKGIVHSHGGIVLEHLKSLGLGAGIGAGDRLFFFSSTSWMVWNWLVSSLLVGATAVLYDGSPGHPDVLGSWRVAAATNATTFGTGAAYLTASEKAGAQPGRDLDLGALRTIISTGSPLPTSTWSWVHDHLPGVRLDSNSGGTDVCGGLVGGSPWLPVRVNRLSGRCLGVKAEAWDADGNAVVGEVGELVVREPMPSMPIAFWADTDGSRLRAAYFERWPGAWQHGDWIAFDADGSAVLSGRSDATLNKAGVRMGSGDIYAVVDLVPGVADSLVVGLDLPDGGYFMPLFVVLEEGARAGEVGEAIRAAIRRDLSPRHLPDVVVPAAAVPRTLTGKRLEIPVKRVLLGQADAAELQATGIAGASALPWYAAFGREHVQPRLRVGGDLTAAPR